MRSRSPTTPVAEVEVAEEALRLPELLREEVPIRVRVRTTSTESLERVAEAEVPGVILHRQVILLRMKRVKDRERKCLKREEEKRRTKCKG